MLKQAKINLEMIVTLLESAKIPSMMGAVAHGREAYPLIGTLRGRFRAAWPLDKLCLDAEVCTCLATLA
jgi:hypothetical protein